MFLAPASHCSLLCRAHNHPRTVVRGKYENAVLPEPFCLQRGGEVAHLRTANTKTTKWVNFVVVVVVVAVVVVAAAAAAAAAADDDDDDEDDLVNEMFVKHCMPLRLNRYFVVVLALLNGLKVDFATWVLTGVLTVALCVVWLVGWVDGWTDGWMDGPAIALVAGWTG